MLTENDINTTSDEIQKNIKTNHEKFLLIQIRNF